MKVATLIVSGLLVFAAGACTSAPAPASDQSYERDLLASRATKDASFKGPESPVPADKRAAFAGLPYYPIDLSLRLPARLKRDAAGPPVFIELQTSTDQRRRMRRVGSLGFAISGVPYTLTAFADVDDSVMARLFVPFSDLTAAAGETYMGGRYIELTRTSTGLYDLDFNRAYHPFCVYSPDYDCPVPPRENRLDVAIRAGEKLGG